LRKRFKPGADIPSRINDFEDCGFLFEDESNDAGFIWMQPAEGALLWSCVWSRPPKSTIVEIGRCEGGSAILMGAAKHEDDRLLSIDNDPVDDPQVEQMLNQLGIKNVELVIADSTTYPADTVKDIGLVFIDGDHSYDGVKADFENWYPWVMAGGLVAFHDVHRAEGKTNGVGMLYKEIIKEDPGLQVAFAGTLHVIKKP
jgi:predicted O-methyltransferase YrrM